MPRPTDTNTTLSLSASTLGDLYPQTLSGGEALNELGSLTLGGYSATALTLSNAVATHLTATLHNDADQRPLDGLVAEIRQLPGDASAERYQVLLRPWLWWLTLASNNRVFQNLATSDIVTQVFDQHGFSDYQLQLSGSYQPREYCVQYGESDLAFVSRLLEEDGIFWFFTHAAGKHTLVLADSNDAFPPIPNGPQVAYLGQGIGVRELQGVRSAQYSLQAVSGTYSATDYEFTTPGTRCTPRPRRLRRRRRLPAPRRLHRQGPGRQPDQATHRRPAQPGDAPDRRERLPLAGARPLVHPQRA